MTWTVTTQNNSGNTVVAPASTNRYVEGQVAVIAVGGVGSVSLLDVGHVDGGPHYWAVRVTSGKYSQLWWYDGDGACTLTINNDNTFTLTGQGQTLSESVGAPVLPILSLPGATSVMVNAFCNAAYTQRLVVTPNNGGINQWQGSGEGNVPIATMATFNTGGAAGSMVPVSVTIDFSSGGNTWQPSLMSPPSQCAVMRFNEVIFVSEDANDYDWNDLTAQLYWWSAS